jgi:hypothetical protein
MSATDPAVGVAKDAGGISAGDPPVDAARDMPAIPSTDAALLGRFPFEARFACAIAEFLLYFPSTKSATNVLLQNAGVLARNLARSTLLRRARRRLQLGRTKETLELANLFAASLSLMSSTEGFDVDARSCLLQG